MKILITGSSGFIGKKLTLYLLENTDATINLAVRSNGINNCINQAYADRVTFTQIDNISSETNWSEALHSCQMVIHMAARVHVMDEQSIDPLTAFREINVAGTLNLAQQAANAGIQRFIYLSSVKVNGEYTPTNMPFRPDDDAQPEDSYSISKHEAELGLLQMAERKLIDVVIIRPPLVYGPGVKGNFQRMMQLLYKGAPLPFGALKKNKRSFVSVENLVNLIVSCLDHPQAANQIFLVSDGYDLSTVDLLKKIQKLLGKPAPLIPVPIWILKSAASLLGKKSELKRLHGSLQVDMRKLQDMLNWKPVETLDEALYKTVQDYLHVKNSKTF